MLSWIVWNRSVVYTKMDLAINNLQKLICHNKQTNKHMYIYMRVIQWIRRILPGSWQSGAPFIVASFSMKPKVMDPFMFQKTVMTFIHRCVRKLFFIRELVYFHDMFSPLVKKNYTHDVFFCKFRVICTSQQAKIRWQTSVQFWSILFDVRLFGIALKEIFWRD